MYKYVIPVLYQFDNVAKQSIRVGYRTKTYDHLHIEFKPHYI